MWIQTIVSDVVEKVANEVQKEEHKNTFTIHVLDPIIQYTMNRMLPYIIVSAVVFFLTFVLICSILYLLLTSRD